MLDKDVTKFTDPIWGVGVCLNVCVIFSFGRGELQNLLLT